MKCIVWAAVLSLSVSCGMSADPQVQYNGIKKTEWLIGGKWISRDSSSYYEETWKRENDSTLSAIGFLTIGSDTVMYEEIMLKERHGDLVYAVKARGENDESVVLFKATKNDEGYHVFENPSHDYPYRIIYSRMHADSLVALVTGNRPDGGKAEDAFRLRREH
jgi:hypothetical protein